MPKRRGFKKKRYVDPPKNRINVLSHVFFSRRNDLLAIMCALCGNVINLSLKETTIPGDVNELGWIVSRGGWFCVDCVKTLEEMEQASKSILQNQKVDV